VLLTMLVSIAAQTSRMKTTQVLPPGYWPLEKSQPIIEKTQTITLSPDLSQLSSVPIVSSINTLPWKDDLHGVRAKNIRDQSRYRFRLFKYATMGE